jgi:anti-anti-sigma factor
MPVIQSWQESRSAEFTSRPGPSATVITAHGEIEAANANQLTDYVEHLVRQSNRVILDLRGLDFIGTAGFSALHRINVVCSAAGAQWVLVPGPAVHRLLRICDPDGTLPTTLWLAHSAKGAGSDEPLTRRGLLQLVAQPR